MKELKKELQSNTVILTSELFETNAFREFALKNISRLYSQGVQLLVHNSVNPNNMTDRGKSVYWALQNFAEILTSYGQKSKDRYINDLLLKVLTESHKNPITVITSSKEMADKIAVIKNMQSFEKNSINVKVIGIVDSAEPPKAVVKENSDIEYYKSLFKIS